MEIDLRRVFSILLNKLKYIVVISLLFAILAFGFTKFLISETYTSTAKFLVVMEETTSKTVEATFVKEAIHSYLELFNTTKFFNEVAQICNEDLGYTENNSNASEGAETPKKNRYTAELIKKMTTIHTSSNSNAPAFSIKVDTTNPKLSYYLANTISEHMIEKSGDYESLNQIEMIDDPLLPTIPSSPNVMRNTVLGLLLGIIFSSALFVCVDLLDKRVKNITDITSIYKIPVLGVVPDTNPAEANKRKEDR